ncbi:MAG TPA: helix-turn-helix domain-containing protein [Nevskiaceae bacterium]|nr:helix-turn-helix domain-containing protein [Nevskiaceae bacterium]
MAARRPFELEAGDYAPLKARAALIGPGVPRRRIVARDGDIAIFDLPIDSPGIQPLCQLLRAREVVELDARRFGALLPLLERGLAGRLQTNEVAWACCTAIRAAGGVDAPRRDLDPRVSRAVTLMGELPLDCDGPREVARHLHLSPSRLRHLFHQHMGTSVGYYHRWTATWRAALMMSQGSPLTEVAHAIGFYLS